MRNKRVLLFLAQGFEEYEASVFTDVMGWSREEGLEKVDLSTTALRNQVKGNWNFTVLPEIPFEQINADDFDALAIPGGFEEGGFYNDAFDERFLNLIRKFHEANKPIASICVGALPLAKSGILKNKPATTYDLSGGHRQCQIEEMGAKLSPGKIVIHDNVITSTGPATAVDVAFHLLEVLTSKKNADVIRKAMRFTD